MQEYHLENWSVIGDYYQAPEIAKIRLSGMRLEDGKEVLTSSIQNVDGRKITTRNSIYILGEPDKDYLKWMQERGIKYDSKNPIKVIENYSPCN